MSHRLTTIALAMILALAPTSCSRHGASDHPGSNAATSDTDADVALPKPDPSGGSVTGMPSKPGPNPVGPALAAAADDSGTLDDEDTADASDEARAATEDAGADEDIDGDTPPVASPGDEPTPQDAVAVLRDYYAAINARDFQQAWSQWSDGGRSSGQTPQQFADGFAGTTQVAFQAGVPGDVDGAAGSRYVEIPVSIAATQRDGSVRRYTGIYTLRRATVDGATDAQRAWPHRFGFAARRSASEVQPRITITARSDSSA